MDVILKYLTYEDVARSGACVDGVLQACKSVGVFFGKTEDMLNVFPGEEIRIKQAAKIDGNGYGNGDGNGYGDGYGDGDGNGDGDGYGDGYGNGDGDGYGDGYGDGNGDRDGQRDGGWSDGYTSRQGRPRRATPGVRNGHKNFQNFVTYSQTLPLLLFNITFWYIVSDLTTRHHHSHDQEKVPHLGANRHP